MSQAPQESSSTYQANQPDWGSLANSGPFRHLIAVKKTFIVPAFIVFLIHYFALAVLVGYFPKLASTRVVGALTLGYLFALSEFAVGWIIAALYLVAAARFDRLTADILVRIDDQTNGQLNNRLNDRPKARRNNDRPTGDGE